MQAFIFLLCNFSSAVQAKDLVAQQPVVLRVQVNSAETHLNVPGRAFVMGQQHSALPRNQEKTLQPVIQTHKSASMGYVYFFFILWFGIFSTHVTCVCS